MRTHKLANQMESFFLAETTKYLYLLFTPDHWVHSTGEQATLIDTPNGQCIINTGKFDIVFPVSTTAWKLAELLLAQQLPSRVHFV